MSVVVPIILCSQGLNLSKFEIQFSRAVQDYAISYSFPHTGLLCVVVQKFVDEDPYVQNDLVTKVDIRPYFAVFSSQLRS